ncbi:MAG: hypothetical protein GXO64_01525 [Candidatus Micrarchaeota archaeon]|nr:hypothetical protein [Candidatus Micrarchaeota archaeon]
MVLRYAVILLVLAALVPMSASAIICGVYFTTPSNDDCAKIENYIFNESNLTGNLTLIKYDLSNSDNINIANMFLEQYGLSEQYDMPENVPFILFDERNHLAGNDEIKECLHLKVEQFQEDGGCPCPEVVFPSPSGAGNDKASDSGGGGGENEGDVPGEPEIIVVNAKDISPHITETEEETDDIDNKRNEKSEKLVNKLLEKDEKRRMEERQEMTFTYAYLAFLAAVIVLAVFVYRKKSRN